MAERGLREKLRPADDKMWMFGVPEEVMEAYADGMIHDGETVTYRGANCRVVVGNGTVSLVTDGQPTCVMFGVIGGNQDMAPVKESNKYVEAAERERDAAKD